MFFAEIKTPSLESKLGAILDFWKRLSSDFFGFVTFLNQNLKDFISVVALDQDFSFFCAASHATFSFE
jgi:hypothetical protein